MELLDRKKPTLILIDEIAHYLDGSKGVSAGAVNVGVGDSNMAVQTVAFIQRLSSKVAQLPNVCVVISLPDIDQVSEKEYYSQVQRVAGRQKQVVTVASDDDIPHIIRRRLFETGEDIISDRASNIIQSYVDECVGSNSIPQDGAEAYAKRFRSTYPFTPDVLDVLYKRWGSYHKFQRTRGALRLLSSVVHSLLDSDRPYITLADIDLGVDVIRKELVSYAGPNTESVISEDITSKQSNSALLGDIAVRAARAIFMYSFPAEDKGATIDDVKRAAFTESDGHFVVGDMLAKMRRSLFYLYNTDDNMFRFTHDENINKKIDRATHGVNDTNDEERGILERGAGKKFRRVYVWPEHYTRIEDIDGLQLVILKEADHEYCRNVVANVSRNSRRVNQNALVFVLPSGNGRLSESIRKLLAVRHVRRIHTDLKPADIGVLKDAEKAAEGGIEVGIREKYTEVWLPDRDDGIRRVGIALAHPDEDAWPFGDTIWDKLVGELQILERMDPGLMGKYGGAIEDIFNHMMRTCGERRPMSLDVVRVAVDRLNASKEPPGGGTDGLGGAVVDYPPPGAKRPGQQVHEPSYEPGEPVEPEEPDAPPVAGVHCTDVVDRNTVAVWSSIFPTLRDIATTTVRMTIDQKGADTFSIHLDMTGEIPRDVADSIRRSVSSNGVYNEDEGW